MTNVKVVDNIPVPPELKKRQGKALPLMGVGQCAIFEAPENAAAVRAAAWNAAKARGWKLTAKMQGADLYVWRIK